MLCISFLPADLKGLQKTITRLPTPLVICNIAYSWGNKHLACRCCAVLFDGAGHSRLDWRTLKAQLLEEMPGCISSTFSSGNCLSLRAREASACQAWCCITACLGVQLTGKTPSFSSLWGQCRKKGACWFPSSSPHVLLCELPN